MTILALKQPDHTDDVWSADDRDWFAKNPNRFWRLRKPILNEVETLTEGDIAADVYSLFQREVSKRRMSLAIAVYQARPGLRLRQLVATSETDTLSSFTDAGIVRMLPGIVDRVCGVLGTSQHGGRA